MTERSEKEVESLNSSVRAKSSASSSASSSQKETNECKTEMEVEIIDVQNEPYVGERRKQMRDG